MQLYAKARLAISVFNLFDTHRRNVEQLRVGPGLNGTVFGLKSVTLQKIGRREINFPRNGSYFTAIECVDFFCASRVQDCFVSHTYDIWRAVRV